MTQYIVLGILTGVLLDKVVPMIGL